MFRPRAAVLPGEGPNSADQVASLVSDGGQQDQQGHREYDDDHAAGPAGRLFPVFSHHFVLLIFRGCTRSPVAPPRGRSLGAKCAEVVGMWLHTRFLRLPCRARSRTVPGDAGPEPPDAPVSESSDTAHLVVLFLDLRRSSASLSSVSPDQFTGKAFHDQRLIRATTGLRLDQWNVCHRSLSTGTECVKVIGHCSFT